MLTNYIKIAWKVLQRHPFYTFITLFGISLTLTVLMVLTSFVDHLIGSHYPETKRDRSLYIEKMALRDSSRSSQNTGPMSFKFLTQYVKSLKTPEKVTITSFFRTSNAYAGSQKIKLNTKYTDAEFWDIMEFTFLEGKPYNDQTIKNGENVAVITDDFRRQYFSDLTEPVVGKDIEVESIHYKVIGVVKGSPPTRFFSYADIYFPYTVPKSNYQENDIMGGYVAVILAKDKSDLKAIQDEFQDKVRRIPLPGNRNGFKYDVLEVKAAPFLESVLSIFMEGGPQLRAIFFSVLAFLMLMLMGLPAINLVNINVSRILERSSEIGIRKAFGAPVRTLLLQFIVENIFITFIGGAIALVLSLITIYFINKSGWIAYADLTINLNVFVVSIGVCLLFGLLSGVAPALRMSKLSIVEALKS